MKLPQLLFILFILGGCASSDLSRYDPAWQTVGASKTNDLRSIDEVWFSDNEDQYALLVSKGFALATAVYSVAAFEVYDKPPCEYETIPFPNIENWHKAIPDKADNSTGFFARSWLREMKDGQKEIVIVFRGTQFSQIADWISGNLVFTDFGLMNDQYGQALEYTRNVLSAFSPEQLDKVNIKLVGHSLGEGLAQFVQRYVDDSQAIAFAPSPNKGRLRSLFYKGHANSIDAIRIFEKGEILQFLRWPFDPDFDFGGDTIETEGMKTRWLDGYRGSVISQHDMQDLSLEILKIAASSSKTGYEREISLNIIEQLEMRREISELKSDYYKLLCNNCERKFLRERVILKKAD